MNKYLLPSIILFLSGLGIASHVRGIVLILSRGYVVYTVTTGYSYIIWDLAYTLFYVYLFYYFCLKIKDKEEE